jgi:uncharacterized protein
MAEPILVAQSTEPVFLLPKMANRHGLIAGATGTGKTVTLQTLAENFSARGVPVFMADVKGDLAGLSQPGANNPKVLERAKELKITDFKGEACPVIFWDVFGEQGHPVRATVSEMGPLLLGCLLELNDTQEGVLNIVFKIADESGLLLLDLKDLRSMLQYVADSADQFKTQYDNVSADNVRAIQRNLLALESQGADKFFGEPALDLEDLIQTQGGKGVINILAADKLMQQSPKVYATFLLWVLSELFENLPEIGDPEKPKLVFFFDEAHLLFTDIPPAVEQKIEQLVRLIRSKGVGVYFVSRNPLDIPDVVLGQLGNRAQHALRAFTPRDQKAVQAAAQTFRQNPKLKVEKVLTELSVGEALVSMLDENGSPQIVERAKIVPPRSQIGAITLEQRKQIISSSVLAGHYEKAIDRESVFEMLEARAGQKVEAVGVPAAASGASVPEAATPSFFSSISEMFKSMGNCKFCGEPAGFFRSKHAECEQRHENGKKQITAAISEALSPSGSFDALQCRLADIAQHCYVSDNEKQTLLVQAWTSAVDRFLEDRVLDESEEKRLVDLKNRFALSETDLDASGAFTKLIKAAVIRDVLSGVIPRRLKVDIDLPINLQKDEQVVWIFPRGEYLEDKTRRQYVGGSQGVSVRIMKGLYYRVGAFAGQPVDRTERVHIDTGMVVVTTKHIYFAGPIKAVRVPYAKIVSFQPFSDGIGIIRDASNAKPQIFVTGDGWFTYNLVTNLAHLS